MSNRPILGLKWQILFKADPTGKGTENVWIAVSIATFNCAMKTAIALASTLSLGHVEIRQAEAWTEVNGDMREWYVDRDSDTGEINIVEM